MDEGERVSVERRPPEETFALLANETRMAILQALGETPAEAVSFSELRARVEERDSGKFNYHLRKLLDHFVRRTDVGYELTLAGQRIVGALIAGTYNASVSLDPVPIESPCPRCGGSLEAGYEVEHVRVHCTDCDDFVNQFPFPPGSLEQFEPDQLPAAFDRWLRALFAQTMAGFCPNCAGRLEPRLVSIDDPERPVRLKHRCERCGDVSEASPTVLVAHHPAGIAFYHDHGVDVVETASWELAGRAEFGLERLADDPVRGRVTVTIDDERLVATVDADATVAEIRREPVGPD